MSVYVRRLHGKDYWFPKPDRNGLCFHFYKWAVVVRRNR